MSFYQVNLVLNDKKFILPLLLLDGENGRIQMKNIMNNVLVRYFTVPYIVLHTEHTMQH